MNEENTTLQRAIHEQRKMLTSVLGNAMRKLAWKCAENMGEREPIEALLTEALSDIEYCKHLYVLDASGHQFVDNITRNGPDPDHFGRNRITRPYMQGIVGITDFKLSESYISKNRKRPMLTAVQVIRDRDGEHVGFLGADYDLRELPATEGVYEETHEWRQIKGDPAIRGQLFDQERVESVMDVHIDDIIPLMFEMMTEHGCFHGDLHFGSSRATFWLDDDPFVYRILSLDELIDPNFLLAYPRRPYTERAIVPNEKILPVFEMFKELRFGDDNIYLRAGSLNVCNGIVSLNFSCDGSHYLDYEEFLGHGLDFWFGNLG